MKIRQVLFLAVATMIVLSGCARLQETARVIWGSSTRALEEERGNAVKQTYQCEIYDCFDAVIALAEDNALEVFVKDIVEKKIVLMDIPESINTTEVGVFLVRADAGATQVEVVSLSPKAQETTAGIIFSGLAETFSQVP